MFDLFIAKIFVWKIIFLIVTKAKMLKGYYHEMVCQLRPLVYSLGLNNPPRICLTPRKTRVKNVWRIIQGNCQFKMVGAGIWSFAKFHGKMPQIATTGITSWQTALKWTADCQSQRTGCQEYMRWCQACGNPRDGYFIRGTHWSAELSKRLNSISFCRTTFRE
jgi:hypothetical protein